MTGNELRKKYLDFFASKQHLVQGSFSLIPQDDPSLLIVAAGMAPLKPFFTGRMTPPSTRMATCQKCVRTNDIENVGYTARHQTFFEMLGNFSFGDYFKREAIAWAWEFVTQHLKLDVAKLYASIYEDDDEACAIWRDEIGLEEWRIVRMGKKDNFWEIGTGPCGPCSELYYDRGPEYGCGKQGCFVGCDCDRYLEFWNLVFTQYDRQEDGSYLPLAKKNIDTGAGLERLASIMQGKATNFETDLLFPIIDYIQKTSGKQYGIDKARDVSMKVIADHGRSVVVMIGDGIMPSNEGRGYVLRRILRRAIRHGKLLGISKPFMGDVVGVVADIYAQPYPDITKNHDYIRKIIEVEEQRFNETLQQGTELLLDIVAQHKDAHVAVLSGDAVFKLYDTYGFPWELTREIVEEHGLSINYEGFLQAMEQQRARARSARSDVGGFEGTPDLTGIVSSPTIYDRSLIQANVLAVFRGESILKDVEVGADAGIVVDGTAFYAEGGGQTGDKGVISAPGMMFEVENVKKLPDGTIVHYGKLANGKIGAGQVINLAPDKAAHQAIARNHSATHILQAVLKQKLGGHVNQAGSQVTAERLRFDFTHFEQISPETMRDIERCVNVYILGDVHVDVRNMSIEEAKTSGAMALFGEKYGDVVRVVRMGDFSLELCGGSHVCSVGEIGLFKIVAEESVAAGVRRIEAVTGIAAVDYVQARERIINAIAATFKTAVENIPERLEQTLGKIKEQERAITQLNSKIVAGQTESLFEQMYEHGCVKCLVVEAVVPDAESLRELGDTIKAKWSDCAVLLAAKIGDKVNFLALSRGAAAGKVHAGNLVKEVAAIAGGGGGGKPDMAQAGGKQPEKLQAALDKARDIIDKAFTGG